MKTRASAGRWAVAVGAAAALACGGGGATEGAGEGSGDGQTAGGESGARGDITVNIDAPEEGQLVVVDPEGRMGFETNVRMELETMPGTSASAAQQFGQAIQARMADIRTCYDQAVASDPEVEGSLRLEVSTDAHGRVSSRIAEQGFEEGRITRCVVGILRRLPRTGVPESSQIRVVLVASNTMAAGTRRVRERNEAGSTPTP